MKPKQRGSPTSCGTNITPAFLRITTWAKLCHMFEAFPLASRGHTDAWESITPTKLLFWCLRTIGRLWCPSTPSASRYL